MAELPVSGTAGSQPPQTAAAARTRQFVLGLDCALIVLIVTWQLNGDRVLSSLLWGILLALPLLAPLPGLLRANRRTFAWCTLCVIPCLVIGLTEAIAQPATRAWSGTCLILAFTMFIALITYLRLTRPVLN